MASIPDQAAERRTDTIQRIHSCIPQAEITTPGIKAGAPIAVALNGKIVATTATWEEGPGADGCRGEHADRRLRGRGQLDRAVRSDRRGLNPPTDSAMIGSVP